MARVFCVLLLLLGIPAARFNGRAECCACGSHSWGCGSRPGALCPILIPFCPWRYAQLLTVDVGAEILMIVLEKAVRLGLPAFLEFRHPIRRTTGMDDGMRCPACTSPRA